MNPPREMTREYSNKLLGAAILSILVAAFLFGARSAVASTDVSNLSITATTTWSVVGSPYIVGDGATVSIAAGASLIIDAGVRVEFGKGSSMTGHGSLDVEGTSANGVIFTSLDPSIHGGDGNLGSNGWFLSLGEQFGTGSGPHTIKNLSVRNTIGFAFNRADVSIENIDIEDSDASLQTFLSTLDANGVKMRHVYRGMNLVGNTAYLENVDIDGGNSIINAVSINSPDAKIASSSIINVGNTDALSLAASNVVISDSIFSHGAADGIRMVTGSIVSLASSTVENFSGSGIGMFGGHVDIQNSKILNNAFGITIFSGPGADTAHISGITIAGNTSAGVENISGLQSDARNNWWGDDSGPRLLSGTGGTGDTGDLIFGDVLFDPWLHTDPFAQPSCCSNVLFLPGLEASRLYLPQIFNSVKQIWEPPLFHNNAELFLNPDGTPVHSNIYTNDIIDEAYGENIYKTFISTMDGLVSDNTINEWEPYPYDWRLDINDIANNSTVLKDQVKSLVAEILRLSNNSKTGKVTIIAHSNGGLIGKLLISKLEEQGRSDLIDKFVMVAVPQIGTPKAVSVLLHGEGLPFDVLPILMSSVSSRQLAENMSSAYTLLPSPEYFNRVLDPVVEFSTAPSQLLAPYVSAYGSTIDSKTELDNFLLGLDGRVKPSSSDLFTPNVLNSTLLSEANNTQQILDNWVAPINVNVIQIAGWGVPTLRGIKYTDALDSSGVICAVIKCHYLDHEPLLTIDGDDTVVTPSATLLADGTYYLNLKKFAMDHFFDSLVGHVSHKSILEIPQLNNALRDLIGNENISEQYISINKPQSNPVSDPPSIRLNVHSPVSIELFDALGRHTGVSTTTIFNVDNAVDRDIPNSYYIEIGEGKYAGTDLEGTTTIQLLGKKSGKVTLGIEQMFDDILIATTTFSGIPVTASSTAVITVGEKGINGVILDEDINGDGEIDASISPGEGISQLELLGLLRGLVKGLYLSEAKESKLLKEIDNLKSTLEVDYPQESKEKKKTESALEKFQKTVDQLVNKDLMTLDEATSLNIIIETLTGTVI